MPATDGTHLGSIGRAELLERLEGSDEQLRAITVANLQQRAALRSARARLSAPVGKTTVTYQVHLIPGLRTHPIR